MILFNIDLWNSSNLDFMFDIEPFTLSTSCTDSPSKSWCGVVFCYRAGTFHSIIAGTRRGNTEEMDSWWQIAFLSFLLQLYNTWFSSLDMTSCIYKQFQTKPTSFKFPSSHCQGRVFCIEIPDKRRYSIMVPYERVEQISQGISFQSTQTQSK